MRVMKVKINNRAYERLVNGKITEAYVINDNVATTRRSVAHEYDSRFTVMRAFMKCSKARHIQVVCDNNFGPVDCIVTDLQSNWLIDEGLFFGICLKPYGVKK